MYKNKTENKDEFVKDEIINQAQILFKQYGLKKTTMDEIAVASGKAKSTLYHYFKSKEEVFDDVINKELKSLRKCVSDSVAQKGSLRDKLQAYFMTFHQETIHRINLYRILKQELQIELSNKSRYNNILDFETKYVNALIVDGIESGELTGIDIENSTWFSELLVVAFLGLVKHSVIQDNEIDIVELSKVVDVILTRIII